MYPPGSGDGCGAGRRSGAAAPASGRSRSRGPKASTRPWCAPSSTPNQAILIRPRHLPPCASRSPRSRRCRSVRIREAEVLDAYGNLPLFVELTERPLRVIGASAQYSTTDGPALRAYWAHRNLFGGAERLRLEGSVFYLTEDGGQPDRDEGWNWDNLGGRFRASFLKPALWGTRNDLLVDGLAERDRTEGYTSRFVNVSAGIRHRFSQTFSIQGGIEYERGQSTDILGSDRLYARRPAGVPELRFHRRPPQSHEGVPADRLGGAISGVPRLLGPDHDRQGHGLDLFLPRRGGPLRARRPHRSGFHRRRGS